MTTIYVRNHCPTATQHLIDRGLAVPLARIFAARGITHITQLDTALGQLLPYATLKGATEMAFLLANAISEQKKLIVIADYDADGATACAVAIRGLRSFGALVDFIVPNRFEFGYGLTPEIVRLAAKLSPDILITVDNGIASIEGVAEANRLGMQVFITDHHLAGDALPDATCIVNPNQAGCAFPSKNLAGVGVMFYVILALRAELRVRGAFLRRPEPNLAALLDLVALGTIADVVNLDQNNRILVQQGLQRIRSGHACAGIGALLRMAKKDPARVSAQDLGFGIGPRLNAAGRLDDMSLGISCLLADDAESASLIAAKLDVLNQDRRAIESNMQNTAQTILDEINPTAQSSLVLFNESWHQGVIGILASRLKDKFHRPTIAFAKSGDAEIKGSGRSIPGLHLRDTLDLVSKRHPNLIRKFGGHSAAAGLSIAESDFELFATAFDRACCELLSPTALAQRIETDGTLNISAINLEFACLLNEQVWGQGFPVPLFDDDFLVRSQRIVGGKHLRLELLHMGASESKSRTLSCPQEERTESADSAKLPCPDCLEPNYPHQYASDPQTAISSKRARSVQAILFSQTEPLPDRIRAVYSLNINEYNDKRNLQLIIHHWQKGASPPIDCK